MTDFCTINGWTLNTEDGSAGLTYVYPGGRVSQSTYNKPHINRATRLPVATGETCILDPDDADTLEGLLLGMGHHWQFDADLWSFDGLGPNAGFAVVRDATGGPWSDGSVTVTDITWTFNKRQALGRRWCVSVWRYSGAVWQRWDVRSDGAVYLNGARDDTLTTSWLVVDTDGPGAVRLTGGDEFADLTVYRFEASDAFLTANYAWQASLTRQNPALPYLAVSGTQFEDPTLIYTASGATSKQNVVQAGGGTPLRPWRNNVRRVPYTLTVTELPPAPFVQIETGAFATTFAMNYGGTSGFVSFGDKADAAVPSPTLTTLNQQPYANHVEGYLVVYDETGALSWVRSINAVNAGTNPRAYFQAFTVDAANDAVYACSVARYDQELRDESGTLLNTLTNTAGTSSNNFFSCFYRFELSTGALVWAQKNDFNTTPLNLTRCRPEGVAILNGRLYFSGFQELDASDRSNFATFNGANHPAANPLGSGSSASTWLLEVDPATGNGIKCICNRGDINTSPFTSSTFIQGGGTQRAHFLVADTVNNRLHLTSNHGGNYQRNEGGIDVGVGDPATFTTRQFSSTSSAGGARGYLATYSEDLSPIAASTIWFTGSIPGAYNSRAMTFRPAILDDGSIVFAYQNGSSAPSPPTINIDRDGTGGSYGGFVLPQPGNDTSTVLIRIPADHGSPTWATSFAVKTNTSPYCRETCVFPNADNTRLLVVHKAQGGAFNDPTVFNGTPSVTQDAQQGYEVVVDAATGAEVWKAANRPQGTNARAKGTGVHEFATGPAAGQIWMPRYFTHGTASQTWGAENPDTSLGYRVGLGWETSTSRGGTGPTTHNYALVMIVRNADGTVDAANCWPIMATNNFDHYSQGLGTW